VDEVTQSPSSVSLLDDLYEVPTDVIEDGHHDAPGGPRFLDEFDALLAQPSPFSLYVLARERGPRDAVGDERVAVRFQLFGNCFILCLGFSDIQLNHVT
jgi:hypothetical protein